MLFKKKAYTTPSFTTFQGNQSRHPFIGSYDINLYKLGDKKQFPYILGVSVQGYMTQENGLPDQKAMESLNNLEDKLIETFNENHLGHYAGHSYWNSSLELLFCISEPDKVIPIFEGLHKAKLPYPFTFKIDSDPNWSQFSMLIGK